MPYVDVEPTLTTYYEDHYFGEPWLEPEVVMLIHGVAESSAAWSCWVPHLSRHLRVLRPDNRGFGRSTAPAADYAWSTARFAEDLARFLDALGVDRVHVVGAKVGGSIAVQFAASFPDRTKTLSVVSGPVRSSGREGRADLGAFPDFIRRNGVRAWAESTQRDRLGSTASEAQLAYWTDFMSQANPEVLLGVTAMAATIDLYDLLPTIKAPTLVFSTESSALQSVGVVRDWQAKIPNSRLLVLPGDSYHPAASHPDECAQAVLGHIQEHSAVAV